MGRPIRVAMNEEFRPIHLRDETQGSVDRASDRDVAIDHAALPSCIVDQELAQAIANDEFDFDVQTIVSLTTGKPIGYELLARWASPTYGRVPPAGFLDQLQAADFANDFDTAIIDKAAESLAVWRATPWCPPSVWINISPNHLDAAFPNRLAYAIEQHGLEPSDFVIELTEEASANTKTRIGVLGEIRELGVRIAIDDFGNGFSQLAYLEDLPIDFVKLDRSMVSGLDHNQRRAVIAESVITLVQSLGARVVAEGVERPQELDVLRQIGCDFVQGFLLSRPITPRDLLGN